METSSVYMCFPCYQEFDTLEEVLKHQLTCTAEEEKPTAPGTAVTVPLLHPQQQVINVARAIVQPLAQVQEPVKSPKTDPVASLKVQDQPRILYQCGDCDELFKSLDLWQEHRKAGACLQSESKGKPDSEAKPETSTAQSPAIAVNPDISSIPKDGIRENVTPEPEAEAAATAVAVALEEGEKIPEAAPVERPGPSVTEARAAASNPDDSSPRRRDRNRKAKPEPVLLCVDCGSCFGMVPELVAHRKTQHGFEEALHRCGVCGESFLNTTLFLYHRKQHRQQGEEEVASQEVSSQSTVTEEPAQLSINVTVSFTQPDLFLCTQCGESCSTGHELLLHRKEKHGLQKPLHSCSQCSAEFMNTTQYLYHRRQHRFISDSTDEATMSVETVITETQDNQSSKRILSPSAAAESGSPLVKRSRPTFRVLSGGQKASKSESEGGGAAPADANATNYPPPAKLLQDWSRTPLPHVCPYCGKTFTRRVFLRTHVYSHTGEKLFTCKVCTKSFTNSQSLLRHSMCHTGAKPYSCNICGKSFSQTATLKRHQRLHNLTQPRRRRGRKPVSAMGSEYAEDLLSCPRCPSMFNTEEQLNYHKLLHTSHPFPCSDCGESFKRRKDLDLHSLTHQDKMPAICPHCSSQFINQTVLEIHLQRCPTTDDDRSAGRGRGQGRGRSTGQVECDLCGHRCMTQEGLDLHRLSHTGQTPLKCPVRPCRRRFISHSALEEHVLAHFQGTLHKSKSRSRFRCLTCHKEFAYNSTFKVHMRTHTDERPFECSTCGKRFRQLPHLQDHERIHSGLRPFCCWICGKSFSVAARLTEHARTHSGEKPYPCPHCPAAFRARANLEKHIRTHSDLPPETAAEAVNAAEVAHVQKVLEGAKVLSSLASSEMDTTAVQTIYVLQGADEGTETVMIPSDQLTGIDGNSQVVILPSSMLGAQTIAVPTITMDGNEITMVEADQSPQHSIEFIVEETV